MLICILNSKNYELPYMCRTIGILIAMTNEAEGLGKNCGTGLRLPCGPTMPSFPTVVCNR